MSMSAALALLLAAQAAPVATATPSAPPAPDADPVICQRIEETGSRLGSKKICMRKSQWAEQRNEDRMLIDRSQMSGIKERPGG